MYAMLREQYAHVEVGSLDCFLAPMFHLVCKHACEQGYRKMLSTRKCRIK